MNITDNRFKKQELNWDELETGKVYVSHRLQKYVMMTDSECLACLETGQLYNGESSCDVFEPVKATLVVE